MPFSYRKQTGGEKRWFSCGGILVFALHCISCNLSVIPRQNCPPWMVLRLREGTKTLPWHHFSLGTGRGKATGARIYGLLTVWVNPSQARVPSMGEVVGKLTACTFSGPNWPYTLVQLHKDTCHVPLPKEGHVGILPHSWAEVTSCRQISQLEVCQLLIAGPPSHLPHRFEWAWWAHCSLPTRATDQQHKSYCRQACLPGNQYSATPSGGPRPKGTASWWDLHHDCGQST